MGCRHALCGGHEITKIQDSPEWSQKQVEAFQGVMDVFHKYDNLAGFFVGNEVITKRELHDMSYATGILDR